MARPLTWKTLRAGETTGMYQALAKADKDRWGSMTAAHP